MRFVIMADGKGCRWNHYLGHDKHEICIGGETLLKRTVRLLRERMPDSEIIITSHNPALETEGAVRYEPKNNVLEIDRFTEELIADNTCFLYGDVFYSESTVDTVIKNRGEKPLAFFGNEKSISAVLIRDGEVFKKAFYAVREIAASGVMPGCKGWQLYHYYAGLPLEGKAIGDFFIRVENKTQDFNTPEDYERYLREN